MQIVSNGDNLHMQIVTNGDNLETSCMKCQILFSGKDKKKIINLSVDDFAYRMIRNTDAIMTYLLTRLYKLPQNELEKMLV